MKLNQKFNLNNGGVSKVSKVTELENGATLITLVTTGEPIEETNEPIIIFESEVQ